MIEQVYKFSTTDDTAIEKLIFDENIHYIHMVFKKSQGPSIHFSNSNVYMTVVRGILSIGLGDQKIKDYKKGTVLKIPVDTKMNIKNLYDDILEFIVVKSPAPHI